jgi:UDP-2-acetamido-3-amino-2,3-dideoxy-glucuronate N-acetyltransferase
MEHQIPRVAVVGCGYWGSKLVRNLHKLNCLHAICDPDEARLSELGTLYNVRATRNYDELLQDPEIQGIVIAAPAARHVELAQRALAAGKDVFVEKPLALRVDEGRALVNLARDRERILMVGHLLEYHPAILEMRRFMQAGRLGRVQYVYSSRLNLGKLRTEENILWSFAPHDISALLFLLGEEPVTVAAHGASYINPNVFDTTLTTCDFASGVQAHIFVSWLHPFKEQKLVVVGDRSMLVFDDTKNGEKLVFYPHQIEWSDRVPVAHKAEARVLPIPADEPLLLECQHFLECVSERKTPRTSGEKGLRVLAILQACEESLKNGGQPVALQPKAARYRVHPTAIVDEPCEIGDRTNIWHFAHVMSGARIGQGCIIGQNVFVAGGVRIGNNVKIQNNVSVYAGVELEDDVFCGPSMVFTNVVNPRSHIIRKHEYKRTLVKRGATLGANSTIVCGITIGRFAFVAAGAVVTHDVPDYALVMGVPARQAGWMCQCGIGLPDGGPVIQCASCGAKYESRDGVLHPAM